jgi:hypothetical protein
MPLFRTHFSAATPRALCVCDSRLGPTRTFTSSRLKSNTLVVSCPRNSALLCLHFFSIPIPFQFIFTCYSIPTPFHSHSHSIPNQQSQFHIDSNFKKQQENYIPFKYDFCAFQIKPEFKKPRKGFSMSKKVQISVKTSNREVRSKFRASTRYYQHSLWLDSGSSACSPPPK